LRFYICETLHLRVHIFHSYLLAQQFNDNEDPTFHETKVLLFPEIFDRSFSLVKQLQYKKIKAKNKLLTKTLIDSSSITFLDAKASSVETTSRTSRLTSVKIKPGLFSQQPLTEIYGRFLSLPNFNNQQKRTEFGTQRLYKGRSVQAPAT
jgi:hypothetical protein